MHVLHELSLLISTFKTFLIEGMFLNAIFKKLKFHKNITQEYDMFNLYKFSYQTKCEKNFNLIK